jgi:hypothetical protein
VKKPVSKFAFRIQPAALHRIQPAALHHGGNTTPTHGGGGGGGGGGGVGVGGLHGGELYGQTVSAPVTRNQSPSAAYLKGLQGQGQGDGWGDIHNNNNSYGRGLSLAYNRPPSTCLSIISSCFNLFTDIEAKYK